MKFPSLLGGLFSSRDEYTKLDECEVGSTTSTNTLTSGRAQPGKWRLSTHTWLNILVSTINAVLLVVAVYILQQSEDVNWLLKQMNSYSPVFDTFQFSMRDTKYNASFFNSPYNIYRGDPSPEVDAAWTAIEYPAQMHFSREEVVKMGKDPEWTAKLPEEWGYGPDRYFGALDGQHLIHCLNLLRKWSHFDHYFPNYIPQSRAPPIASAHKDHCVAVLLQHLTCQPSLNMITYSWMETQTAPFPDFDINRKCQNHGELLEWQNEREIAKEFVDVTVFEIPKGVKVRPADPQWAKLEGWVWNGSAPLR